MSTISKIDGALSAMRAMEVQAKSASASAPIENGVKAFGNVLGDFIADVNTIKIDSDKLQDRYVKGDPNVSLPQVMLAAEKANIQLNFLTEVRNKLLHAYDEISKMNM
jgi:flagellar hook-basal body complex protein FliE